MSARESLKAYRDKRDFAQTPEPSEHSGLADAASTGFSFVVQKHAARNLHYDFRLELDGTLKSWAVPKGPSLDPTVKRMGVLVEDHPLGYADFEGSIPLNQYGAGDVIVWDRGIWEPLGNAAAGLLAGKLKFKLHGEKLAGGWTLVRMHGRQRSPEKAGKVPSEPWLLIKEQDAQARPATEFDVLTARPDSVLSGKPLRNKGSQNGPAADLTAKTSAASPARKARTLNTRAKTKAGVSPTGAVKSPLPARMAPQLATLLDSPPPQSSAEMAAWIYEIKFDGYRLLTRIDGESITCFTRNGHDWTAKLPALVKALAAAELEPCWLDGEIVVLNPKGLPDFGALQNAFDSKSTAAITYHLFDLPFYDGLDLRLVRLAERREILRTALAKAPQDTLRFSEAFEQAPQDLLASAAQLGLEGVIGKRADAAYTSGRSRSWIKLKTQHRQEFVIGGYTEPKGSRAGLGALLLGVHDAAGKLQYAGNVGTGFDEKTLASVKARLMQLHSESNPFADAPADLKGKLPAKPSGQWVKPQLLAEVTFAEWTAAGRIRHAVFKGLRGDKPAKNIVRELPAAATTANSPPGAKPGRSPMSGSSIRITHPDRVIDATRGFTKQDLVDHYEAVAPLLLPHLKARPVSLVRAPSGIDGELFFQKHAEVRSIPGIKLLDPSFDPGHAPLLEITSSKALLESAQMNTLEFHTWNATTRAIRKPDRMTFDLDPGDGVRWAEVQDGARLVKTMLDELGLASFLKTSGGKGLHVVVPLKPSLDFDTVKAFSHTVVDHLARIVPQRFVAKSGPKNRIGKIFVDYLRNGFGATTVAAWALRARPGLGVSVPVSWDELDGVSGGDHWKAGRMTARIGIGNQPWTAYESSRNSLTRAMMQIGFKPAVLPTTGGKKSRESA